MRFAKSTFLIAGIYGIIALVPMYFMEASMAEKGTPAAELLSRPEFFYGFIGVALAWQIVFLIMSRDPLRYRPLMLVAVLEKVSFGMAVPMLFLENRAPTQLIAPALIDMLLGVLFLVSYALTSKQFQEKKLDKEIVR